MGANARTVFTTVLLISSLFLSLRPATSQVFPFLPDPGMTDTSPASSPSSSLSLSFNSSSPPPPLPLSPSPSPSPSSSPSPSPSSSPSPSPSSSPSPSPSSSPSLSPSSSPSPSPSPSPKPSPSPSPKPSFSPTPFPSFSPSPSPSPPFYCSLIWNFISRACESQLESRRNGSSQTSSDPGGPCCFGVQQANDRLCLCRTSPEDSPSLDDVSYVAEKVCGVVPEALNTPGSRTCRGLAPSPAPNWGPAPVPVMEPSPDGDNSPIDVLTGTERVGVSASSGSERNKVSMSLFSFTICSVVTVAAFSKVL